MTEPSLHDYAWAHELYDELLRYRKALEKIDGWEMPPTGQYWSDGSPKSYSTLYGSRGEQDYIRRIAFNALENKQSLSSKGERQSDILKVEMAEFSGTTIYIDLRVEIK